MKQDILIFNSISPSFATRNLPREAFGSFSSSFFLLAAQRSAVLDSYESAVSVIFFFWNLLASCERR
jgi:hypothetical protein